MKNHKREKKPSMVSERLSYARRMSGLKLREVRDRTGISQSALCDYEAGHRNPSLETLKRLADAYGRRAGFFLGADVSCNAGNGFCLIRPIVIEMENDTEHFSIRISGNGRLQLSHPASWKVFLNHVEWTTGKDGHDEKQTSGVWDVDRADTARFLAHQRPDEES